MESRSTKPLPAESVASTVRRLAREHNAWRGRCLNLIASENVTSVAVREFMTADFAHRYAEGDPFQRYYCGTKFIDEIETMAVQLAEELFTAEHVNVRVISGAQANMALFYALTKPGDSIMSLPVPCGGHISYMKFGCAGARGLKVEKIPFNAEEMTIDENALAAEIEKLRPIIVLLGG
ncbi:MAG: serine hydroxymethyltransferase, partial [Candidatus Bathyarchaeia archaeon]